MWRPVCHSTRGDSSARSAVFERLESVRRWSSAHRGYDHPGELSLSLRSGELYTAHFPNVGHETDATIRGVLGARISVRVQGVWCFVRRSVSGLSGVWGLHHRARRLGLTNDESVARFHAVRRAGSELKKRSRPFHAPHPFRQTVARRPLLARACPDHVERYRREQGQCRCSPIDSNRNTSAYSVRRTSPRSRLPGVSTRSTLCESVRFRLVGVQRTCSGSSGSVRPIRGGGRVRDRA